MCASISREAFRFELVWVLAFLIALVLVVVLGLPARKAIEGEDDDEDEMKPRNS
jgi:hypothetical protein